MRKLYTFLVLIILNVLLTNLIFSQPFNPPVPEPGSATIDGSFVEWNLTDDFFADMYQAGNQNKPLMAKCYVRYDCNTSRLYVLVLVQGTYLIQDNFVNENWIKIKDITTAIQNPINFAYIPNGSNEVIGWEASYSLTEGNYTQFEVHALIIGEEPDETSTTNDIQLKVTCPLPVELTSFSVVLQNSVAQLIWETATEVNNYGFEIQRSTEQENWNKVGFIQGHGNSNSPKYYTFTDNSVEKSGTYNYRLKQIDIDGQYEYSPEVEISLNVSEIIYRLGQNYPNPFNPSTTISFTLPEREFVSLRIYNLFGEEVSKLVSDIKEAGSHSVVFNAENLASGMYYYTIETSNFVSTKKLLLLK